ncbi:MAG: HYR domain-containing protein [Haliscomenobacteraceae bacterium CHB4]|nr:HYR domain-containing protein [Haliscomenobacteraceae bacterium CHB4]
MGGGGGAGHANDNVGSSGGHGGGIIILRANTIAGNNNRLAANGENIFGPGGNNVNDGQGGGGAGGTIVVDAQQVSSPLHLEAKGGRGGDCLFYVNSQIIGPGGGGGGGRILLAQPLSNISTFLEGGQNGIANQNQTNGAQPGGVGLFGADFSAPVFFEDTILAGIIFVTQNLEFCPGSSATINGTTYDQPGTVLDTIPGVVGCDTVITYNLQYSPVDLVFDIENVSCQNGSLNLQYSLCNQGSGSLPAEVRVLFTVVNPTTDTATTLVILNFNTAGADSCLNGAWTVSGLPLDDNSTVYSVVNFNGSLPTPFSFDDFPVTDIEECNYTNNLDSFVVQLPGSPAPDLGPDVVLCEDSTVVFDAGAGFFSYLWSDGSTGQTLAASEPDIYWVEVTDSCGFKQRDSVLLTLSLLPDTQFPDTSICAGESLFFSVPGFDSYIWAPAAGLSCTDCADVTISPAATTTYTLLATTTDGCVLRDTFTVTLLPVTTEAQTIAFCPGESVTIGGVTYDQPGTVVDTTTGPNGCDLITTYTLVLLSQPTLAETIVFCKGDTVYIGGTAYAQPGTVVVTLPAATGCDTVATYTLQYLDDPNAVVTIDCIEDINIATQPGTGPIVIAYDLPVTSSNCPCPGIELTLTEGLPSGSLFPVTTTKVCYQAADSCGNTATCCFNVTVREEQPCDIKTIGCMKYELLDIARSASTLDLTYRIRVTNYCANKMIYTAIQIPDGMVAEAPANNSIYTSEDGREYEVRNPNFSPFYSIRFKSTDDSLSGGNSDIFVYTLPAQADVDYIHVTSRLYPQIFYEAHLNTFNCPVEIVDDKPGSRDFPGFENPESLSLRLFPNPTGGVLYADMSDWRGGQVQWQVFDSRGQRVQHLSLTAEAAPQEIRLPRELPNGLYFLEIRTESGEKRAARFVIKR